MTSSSSSIFINNKKNTLTLFQMKNFFALALVASIAIAQEQPDNQFPEEWDEEPQCDDDDHTDFDDFKGRTLKRTQCSTQPVDHPVEEVMQYDQPLM